MSEPGAAILVVEDDLDTRRSMAAYLRGRGHAVREAATVHEALSAFEAARPDLILLDLGLPDLDGASVVRRVRAEATTPILIVSARDREEDKVSALEAGADDYVIKPFGMGELLARIHALLRRAAGPAADDTGVVTLGALRLDPSRREVTVSGRAVHLTPREYEVLKVLVAHAGHLVTHGRLLRAVWGTNYGDEAHYVHVYVSQIRRKLANADPEGRLGEFLVAEPGVGYRVAERRSPFLERTLSD
jgi:two-component system KDP operon response regulator KdpE